MGYPAPDGVTRLGPYSKGAILPSSASFTFACCAPERWIAIRSCSDFTGMLVMLTQPDEVLTWPSVPNSWSF